MITLLLVEDEAEAREGLKKFLPWESIGVDRVEEAVNGLAAVDLCEGIRPDILLTDVRMPKMDGIQLAFYIRERFPLCKIIFISGYSDKQYLKSAIKIGAVSYIEKPIDIQELQQTLSQAVEQCCHDWKKREEEEYRSDVTRKGLPLILQKLAAGVCFGGRSGEDALLLARHLGIVGSTCFEATMAVKLHQEAALTDVEGEYFRNDMIAFINGNGSGYGDMKPVACFLDGISLVIHCFFPAPADAGFRFTVMSAFIMKLNEKYAGKFVFTAVAGDVAENYTDIAQSFRSAQRLVKTMFYLPRGVLHAIRDVPNETFVLSDDIVNEFDALILHGRPEETHAWLERLEEAIRRLPMSEIGFIKNVYFNLYGQLSAAAKKQNRNVSLLDGDRIYFWQELSVMETLSDITRYLHSLITSYFNAADMSVPAGSATQEIMDYIHAHYCDVDLSIKKIADFSHYDYYYLCSLFKKKAKMTINDYIAKVRVEKAIGLLKERRVKLHDITGMVGYSDPSYFTKLFKKHMGTTPSEFREKHNI